MFVWSVFRESVSWSRSANSFFFLGNHYPRLSKRTRIEKKKQLSRINLIPPICALVQKLEGKIKYNTKRLEIRRHRNAFKFFEVDFSEKDSLKQKLRQLAQLENYISGKKTLASVQFECPCFRNNLWAWELGKPTKWFQYSTGKIQLDSRIFYLSAYMVCICFNLKQ